MANSLKRKEKLSPSQKEHRQNLLKRIFTPSPGNSLEAVARMLSTDVRSKTPQSNPTYWCYPNAYRLARSSRNNSTSEQAYRITFDSEKLLVGLYEGKRLVDHLISRMTGIVSLRFDFLGVGGAFTFVAQHNWGGTVSAPGGVPGLMERRLTRPRPSKHGNKKRFIVKLKFAMNWSTRERLLCNLQAHGLLLDGCPRRSGLGGFKVLFKDNYKVAAQRRWRTIRACVQKKEVLDRLKDMENEDEESEEEDEDEEEEDDETEKGSKDKGEDYDWLYDGILAVMILSD